MRCCHCIPLFSRDEMFTKSLKTRFLHLFVTTANHTVYSLYVIHAVANIRNYIFTKQSSSTKLVKIVPHEEYCLFSSRHKKTFTHKISDLNFNVWHQRVCIRVHMMHKNQLSMLMQMPKEFSCTCVRG